MFKKSISLRNVLAIAICLAGITMFSSCVKSSENQILSFYFITPAATGIIDDGAKTIMVSVPNGTDLTALIPTILVSEKAMISPESGVATNFTNPVKYTVTAEDGSIAEYTVMLACAKSSEKKILSFDFLALSMGEIDEETKTVMESVPAYTDLTAIIPIIVVSEKATISPESGVVTDFTKVSRYTVTAEDGSTVVYRVIIDEGSVCLTPIPLYSPITENLTLSNSEVGYSFDGLVLEVLNNAILTINEGVTIRFHSSDGCLKIHDGAMLKAIGTADKHIRFWGESPWRGIEINTQLANELKYVDIINAGSGNNEYDAALYLGNGKADVNYCLIDRSAANGITVTGISGSYLGELSTFSNNTISNCDKAPIFVGDYADCYTLRNISNNNTFTGNNHAYIHISQALNFTILDDMTLPSLNAYPWYFENGLHIDANRNFTIEPGALILMGLHTDILIPAESHFIAVGTAQAPINIKAFKDELGYWGEIYVESATAGTKFDHCNISGAGYGGSGKGNIRYYRESYIEIYNTHISKSIMHGLVCAYSSCDFNPHYNAHLKHANVTFSEITGSVFFISAPDEAAYPELPTMNGDTWWQCF